MKNIIKILLSAMIVPMILIPTKVFALDSSMYTVQKGDSLWSISAKLGISINYLKTVNDLNKDTLEQGQVLKLIPDKHNYTVKSGDTLRKVATNNNTTVNYIKKLNNLNTDSIYVGQVIKLLPDTITHTVQQGDTLYLLAKNYGTTVDDIKYINHLTLTKLVLKQKLLIPYKTQQLKENSSPVISNPTPVMTSSSTVVSTPQPVKNYPSITYIVQAGDTASSIAKKLNVSTSDILKYNYMTNNDWFSQGQKIAINGYAPRDYAVIPGMDKGSTQYGHLVDWFRDGQYLLKRNDVFTIIDYKTRKQFKVKVLGGYNHCDIEPLTTSDTSVMKGLFGSWNWTPRPVIIFKDGMNIAGSLSGMPHSFDSTPNNGVVGHFDLYLKNSIPHDTNTSQAYVQQHYNNILISSGQNK